MNKFESTLTYLTMVCAALSVSILINSMADAKPLDRSVASIVSNDVGYDADAYDACMDDASTDSNTCNDL